MVLECGCGKLAVGRAQRLAVEYRVVTLEESLDDIQDRRLADSRLSVEDQELLDPPRVSGNDGTDSPLELVLLFRSVEQVNQFRPCRDITLADGVGQTLACVVGLLYLRVREDEFVI